MNIKSGPTRPTSRRSRPLAVLAALALVLTFYSPTSPVAAQETTGTDFWIGFNSNYTGNPELTVFISGGTATDGTVTPMGSAPIPFTVTPGAVTSVPIPTSQMMTGADTVEDKGVHVQAGAPVSVYGLSRIQFTTDAFLAIPTEAAGTEFRVMTYGGTSAGGLGAVATADGTTLTITPSVDVGTHLAGDPFTVDLNQGQTYQLAGTGDLTGTTVSSTSPISVYGYNACTNIPPGSSACDHIVEQLPPTSAWGTSFLAARLAERTLGDTYRILADEDGTVVTIDGVESATLAAGEYYEAVLPTGASGAANEGVEITTSLPSLVAQFSNGTSFDGVTSDPFMMLVPPYEQFQNAYTVTTPASGFTTNYLNVVVPTADIGSFQLDGAPVGASSFEPIGASGFSSAQLPVALGSHTVSSGAPFGVFVYGFAEYDSYGYPGGYLLSPIAAAAALTLDQEAYTAAVGGEICPVATVVDDGGAPLAGLTVTFAVDNPEVLDSAVTDASGRASVCFTNSVESTGTLVATTGLSIGALTDSASVTFATATTPPPTGPQALQVTPRFTG